MRKEEEFWRGRKIQGENMSYMKDPSVKQKAVVNKNRSIVVCLRKVVALMLLVSGIASRSKVMVGFSPRLTPHRCCSVPCKMCFNT